MFFTSGMQPGGCLPLFVFTGLLFLLCSDYFIFPFDNKCFHVICVYALVIMSCFSYNRNQLLDRLAYNLLMFS